MGEVPSFSPGGYRYIKAVFQYSAGVAARAGFRNRSRAPRSGPCELPKALTLIASHLGSAGPAVHGAVRLRAAIAGAVYRAGFVAFNRDYVQTLERWGLSRTASIRWRAPTSARRTTSRVEPSFHAFSYTVRHRQQRAAELRRGRRWRGAGRAMGGYRDDIVRLGDTSARKGLREKVRYVMAEMQRRLAALGFGWRDAVRTQAYTVHDIGSLVAEEIVQRGAAPGRPDMASLPPAGRWARLRNGCARRRRGTRALARRSMSTGGLGPLLATI